MLEKFQKLRKKLNNVGSSFVMVIVAMAFLMVLVASILSAATYCFKLKLYNRNSRNNFYYVEQAMDEVYAGVGNIAIKYLQKAYEDTAATLIYYDPAKKAYVTRDNKDANYIMKQTFVRYLQKCPELKPSTLSTQLSSYITNPEVVLVPGDVTDPVYLNIEVDLTKNMFTLKNITLKRNAHYKVNGGEYEEYTQSITTDIVLSEPPYDLSFDGMNSDFSDLYDYALLADSGIEVSGMSTQMNVSGNVYGAADFYDKTYNTYNGAATDVSSYLLGEDRQAAMDGRQLKSMNSGFFIDGANVVLQSNNIIVPGTMGVFNNATLSVSAKEAGTVVPANMWLDNIVLGGFTTTKGAAKADLYANVYVYDDMELNANVSYLKLKGKYYGYNYGQYKDKRNFISAVGTNYQDVLKNNHYNSSSILINGQNTTLDLKELDALYIAGLSYVELNKKISTTEEQEITNKDGETEKVEVKKYIYDNTIKDYVTGESLSVKSNQLAYIPLMSSGTIIEHTDASGKKTYEFQVKTNLRDAYKNFVDDLCKLPLIVQERDGEKIYFFDIDSRYFKPEKKISDYYHNDDAAENELGQEQRRDENGNIISNAIISVSKEQFLKEYVQFFKDAAESELEADKKAAQQLRDITNYEKFPINEVILPTDDSTDSVKYENIYSKGALTMKTGAEVEIISSQLSADVFDNMLRDDEPGTSYSNYMNATKMLYDNYNLLKYHLNYNVSAERKTEVLDILSSNQSLSPINKFFNVEKITGDANSIDLPSGYRIWISDEDILVTDKSGGDGNIQGIIVTKGDVTFSDDVNQFQGLIVAGGKIKVDRTTATTKSISFIANAEVCKSALRECEVNGYDSVIDCFKDYGRSKTEGAAGGSGSEDEDDDDDPNDYVDNTTNLDNRTIDQVIYSDILAYKNWKKNVE